MSAPTRCRETARDYLQRGWAPIPVPHKRKSPGYDAWQKLRLTEADLPTAFPTDPMNVSVLPGAASGGLADVDLDVPQAILLADAFLPPTQAEFGRASARRAHRLFGIVGPAKTTTFEDPTVEQGDPERGMLVEFRFSGHTLFPGSTHPSDESITWDIDGEPASVTAEELLARIGRLASAVLLARHWPGEGKRHQAALALAGALLRAGWTEVEVARFLSAVAWAAGDDEPDDRVRAAVSTAAAQSAGQATTGWPRLATLLDPRVVDAVRAWLGITDAPPDPAEQPWDLPTPLPEGQRPPFPVDRLRGVLGTFVAAVALATQTPPALAALLVLAVLAAAAATRVVVRVRAGWIEPVNLFIAVALGPANRKSSVFGDSTAPLEAFERAELTRLAPELAERQSAIKIKKKELERLETRASDVTGKVSDEERAAARDQAAALARELATTPVPEPPRLVVDDCSPEKLTNLLAAQGGRIAVMSPEGGVFEMMGGRYSSGNQPNLDVYLKGHAGDPLRVDRIGRPPDHVPRPALTIGLAVQPDVIRKLAEKPEFRGRGLPARFLYGMPASLVGSRRIAAPPVPGDVRAAYAGVVTAILELPRFVDDDGQPKPKELVLSDDAAAHLRSFEERLEPRLAELGDLGHVADWGGKLAGATCRVAGLLHVAQHAAGKAPWDTPIAGQTMADAIVIADGFFVPHALTAFATMGADAGLEAGRKLLGWLGQGAAATFSVRDAHQHLRRHDLSTAQVERAAELLAEHGYLSRIPDPPGPKGAGRPPSPRYLVNPRWRAQNTQYPHNPPNDAPTEDFEDCVDSVRPDAHEHTPAPPAPSDGDGDSGNAPEDWTEVTW